MITESLNILCDLDKQEATTIFPIILSFGLFRFFVCFINVDLSIMFIDIQINILHITLKSDLLRI